jgi:glycosyltransferase involved in cell wall biosynthesis
MNSVVAVSVVIPCFNCESTIHRAIQSIVAQKSLPSQIIFINDCSTDSTQLILDGIKLPNPVEKTIIRLDRNYGPARSRNLGIEASKNSLVAFLDADDSWHSGKIKIQYDLMQRMPDVNLSGHIISFYDGEDSSGINESAKYEVKDVTFRSLLFKNAFNTPSVMLRRSNLRFPETLRYAEDYYLWLATANAGYRLLFIKCQLGFVHKPFYGHSGLSQSLQILHQHEIRVLSEFRTNLRTDRSIVNAAIFFAHIKYWLRLLKMKIRSVLHRA